MVNKGSNYHCGGELYYPAAAGYQVGFIQSIPIPPMDSINLLSSWRVEFNDAKEVTTLMNFNQDLVKSFSIPIKDPRFGDSNIFIHWWKEMSAGWFSQPCSEIEDRVFRHCPCSLAFQQEKEKKKAQAKTDTAEKENPPTNIIKRESSVKSTDANSGRGEKRPNAPIQGDNPAGNIVPSQTFLRPRKIPRNLSPQGFPRPAEHPSSSHSTGAMQSATTLSATPETQTSVLEKEIRAQTMTSVGEDESAEVHTTGHSEEVSMESHETIPMPEDHSLEHADVVESTAITVDYAIVTSGTSSTIPTNGNAPPEPVLMLTSGAPALVLDAIPSEFQLEIGESSSFVPAEITMNPSVEDGRSLTMVPREEAPLPSPDQASTRLATSSTRPGALPDSGAEALLRSYKDGDLMSLEDKNERTKLKAAIETLASSGFFPNPPSAAMITYLFSQVEEFAPRRRPFLEEQRIGQDLEQRITSCSATMRREIEIVHQMQQEAADIDEQVRQLQERKASIVAKVSEIVRSNRPLEAQL
ncbi:unnamed protein product [Prunus armeniaca]